MDTSKLREAAGVVESGDDDDTAIALRSAADEIDQLRADKARLDFLDRCNERLNAKYGTVYRWRLILNHNVNRLMLGEMMVDLDDSAPSSIGLPSCRDAIDAEMRRIDGK